MKNITQSLFSPLVELSLRKVSTLVRRCALVAMLAFTSVVSVPTVWAGEGSVAKESAAENSAVVMAKVSINHADAETMAASLTGVGLKRAQAIVAYREQVGSFSSVEQLAEVKGIGEKLLAKNEGRILLK